MITNATAKTFQNDLHLPVLPSLKIDLSLKMYLDCLDAILPLHLFMKYKDNIEKMIATDGQILDFSRARVSANLKNWIEIWWLKWYHLASDTELIPYSSICGFSTLHRTIWPADTESQITRGSQYLHALLLYWNCLRQEIIAPERSKNGEMLSMGMYRNIFNSSRIPSSTNDKIFRHFRTNCEGHCPNHITVCIKGYVFKVSFIEKEIIWPLEKITSTFIEIYNVLKNRDHISNLTAITTLQKAQMISALKFAPDNSTFIEDIHKSVLWFSFDEATPHIDHILMSVMGSDCHNRCGIKSLSVTVFANGLIGLNADSAMIDPDVFIKVIQFADNHISKNRTLDDYPLRFKYMENMTLAPNIYNEYENSFPLSVNNELLYMSRVFNMKVFQMDCSYRHFKWFNLEIAKSMNIDPCITVHLLLLLTYWGVHKSICSACAIVSHRKYYRGRHDMVPTVNLDTVTWIKAVHSLTCPPHKLKTLFIMAHRRLQAMFKVIENNCGPILHLNYLNSTFRDTSSYLRSVCDDNYWFRTGFNGHFGMRTIYLGDVHVVTVVPDITRFGYSVSYSVDRESTLVSVIHRCGEDQLNPRLPKIFLKEFLTSVELLNQMFTI